MSDDGGFDNYVETTVDPGIWLLLGTCVFCVGVMVVVVPILVYLTLKRRKTQSSASSHASVSNEQLMGNSKERVKATVCSILTPDKETRKILMLAVPYTISALASSTLSNMCLILVSKHIGTKAVTAYALVQILVGLTDGMLKGPIYACTTLCAHAVGAGNSFLAGQYIQLAIIMYLLLNIPVVYFWWFYMYEIILYLEWGDEEISLMSQEFIRVYIWSYILGGISCSVWQLLEVADHTVSGTIMSIAWGATNVLVIGLLVTMQEATLMQVGYAYIATAVFYIGLTLVIGRCKGWFAPFSKGLLTLSICNFPAIGLIMKQAIPLAFGALLSNAEWAILTFFASHLGAAEVAAWAILGSIWEVFYSVTAGIGDAAEIRVAFHLGDNHPTMARLSAYKSLFLGMVVACVVSVIYFSLQHKIPSWFTSDATLQAMLAELVPFVGVANLTMTFGMQCWSLIGAQGKYKLATWITFFSSWGVSMPLAAVFVFVFHIDLQGLTSAVVIGYLTTGASLSYILLSTDWYKVARKIQEQNADTANGQTKSEDDINEEFYASLRPESHAAVAFARRNIRLLTVPSGYRSGILLGNIYARPGTYVLMVREWSPLYKRVRPGDSVLAMDGVDLSGEGAESISSRLKTSRMFDRQLAFTSPPADDEVDDELIVQIIAEDESDDRPAPDTDTIQAELF